MNIKVKTTNKMTTLDTDLKDQVISNCLKHSETVYVKSETEDKDLLDESVNNSIQYDCVDIKPNQNRKVEVNNQEFVTVMDVNNILLGMLQ